LATEKKEREASEKEKERIRKEKEQKEKELEEERKRKKPKTEAPLPLKAEPAVDNSGDQKNYAKQRELQRKKDEILNLAQNMLDTEKDLPMIMKLSEHEIASLYQKYISWMSAFQLPFFCFALLELTACVTFGHMRRCDHAAIMWLNIDSMVTLGGALLYSCFCLFCLSPVYSALDQNPVGYGRRLKSIYDGDSLDGVGQMSAAKRKAALGKSRQVATVFATICNQGQGAYTLLSCVTGGLAAAVVFGWVPVMTVLALMGEIPSVLTLFIASCDPSLDFTILAFVTIRGLYIADVAYRIFVFCFGSDRGYVREHVVETSMNTYLERMEAGIGMRPAREDLRYQWYPDSLKPESYKDIDRIDTELRLLQDALDQKPLLR